KRGISGCFGLCCRCFSKSANDHLLTVLEELHHARCPLVDVWRVDLFDYPDPVLARAVGCLDLILLGRGPGALPADKPRHYFDPTVVPFGMDRFEILEGSRECRQTCRN